jgi:hypothetical protein
MSLQMFFSAILAFGWFAAGFVAVAALASILWE